jgi:hypothetical protein
MAQKRSPDAETDVADTCDAKRAAALPATLNTEGDTTAELPEVQAQPRAKFGEGSISLHSVIFQTHLLQEKCYMPHIEIDAHGDIALEYYGNGPRDAHYRSRFAEIVPRVDCAVNQTPLNADLWSVRPKTTRMPFVPVPYWTAKYGGNTLCIGPVSHDAECAAITFPGVPKYADMDTDHVNAYAYATDGHGTHAVLAREPSGGKQRYYVIVCSDAEPFRSMRMPADSKPHALAFDPVRGMLVLLVYMDGDTLCHRRWALVFVRPLAWMCRQKAEFDPVNASSD